MPYIAPEQRPEFDSLVQEFLSDIDAGNWPRRFLALVVSLGEEIYGEGKHTRYYLQNEYAGVLASAAREWARRVGGQAGQFPRSAPLDSPNNHCAFVAAKVAGTIAQGDVTLRPGCLNYFLTSVLIAACQKHLLAPRQAPSLLILGHLLWYERVTGPYEDQAIARNGDCFPVSLLRQELRAIAVG